VGVLLLLLLLKWSSEWRWCYKRGTTGSSTSIMFFIPAKNFAVLGGNRNMFNKRRLPNQC